jgi:hypothetical protein
MEPVTVYAIFYDGQYLRKTGWHNQFEWANSINDAKLYIAEEHTKKDMSKVVNGYVSSHRLQPVKYPEIHVYTMTFERSVDQTEKFKKNRERAEKAARTREANHYARMAEDAQKAVERAQKDLEFRKEEAAKFAENARQKKTGGG